MVEAALKRDNFSVVIDSVDGTIETRGRTVFDAVIEWVFGPCDGLSRQEVNFAEIRMALRACFQYLYYKEALYVVVRVFAL